MLNDKLILMKINILNINADLVMKGKGMNILNVMNVLSIF